LHALFVAALLLLCSGTVPNPSENKLDYATGLACGLAIGNHLTAVFLLPLALFWKRDWKTLWRRAASLALGLSSYLILPLRAAGHAPVNWGGATSWNGFIWLVSGRLYQDDVLALTLPGFLERIQMLAALLLKQFGAAGLIFAFLGAALFFTRSRFHANLVWSATGVSIFSLLYAARDWQVYLIPAVLCLAVWVGIALGNLMRRWPRRQFWLAGLFFLWLAFSAAQTWPSVDLSRDLQAEQFGASILAQTPQDAMLFVTGDGISILPWENVPMSQWSPPTCFTSTGTSERCGRRTQPWSCRARCPLWRACGRPTRPVRPVISPFRKRRRLHASMQRVKSRATPSVRFRN